LVRIDPRYKAVSYVLLQINGTGEIERHFTLVRIIQAEKIVQTYLFQLSRFWTKLAYKLILPKLVYTTDPLHVLYFTVFSFMTAIVEYRTIQMQNNALWLLKIAIA